MVKSPDQILKEYHAVGVSLVSRGLAKPLMNGEVIDPFDYKMLQDTGLLFDLDLIEVFTYEFTDESGNILDLTI